jgi:hypothetical protein
MAAPDAEATLRLHAVLQEQSTAFAVLPIMAR